MTEPAVSAPPQQSSNGAAPPPAPPADDGFATEAAAERKEGREKALAALGTLEKATEDPGKSKPDAERAEKADEKTEKKLEPTKTEGSNLEAKRAELKKALEGLSEEQVAELLGATSAEFAALSGKRQQLKRQQETVKTERAAIAAERTELQSVKSEFDEALIEAKTNPRKWMELGGWSIEDALHYDVTDGEEPVERKLKRLEGGLSEKVEAKLKELEQGKQELARQKAEHSVREYHSTVRNVIASRDTEALPLLGRYSDDEIFQNVTRIQNEAWEESGKTKSVATSVVLRYLEAQLQYQLEKLTGAKSPPARVGSEKSEALAGQERPRHLTERDASERSRPPADDDEDIDPAERRQRALAMLG